MPVNPPPDYPCPRPSPPPPPARPIDRPKLPETSDSILPLFVLLAAID